MVLRLEIRVHWLLRSVPLARFVFWLLCIPPIVFPEFWLLKLPCSASHLSTPAKVLLHEYIQTVRYVMNAVNFVD